MPKLEMLNIEDSKVHVAVNRALSQVGHVLKDHGLYVTIDADGNYSVDRLPVDFPIKDERVCDRLRRTILDGWRRDKPLSGIRLSDEHARKFAAELFDMQLDYKVSEADIYKNLIDGGSRFMDIPVAVYSS